MNLSVGFALGSLLFLTPALVLLLALRVYYPINRTLAFLRQGLVLPASALLISVAINGPVLLDYLNWSSPARRTSGATSRSRRHASWSTPGRHRPSAGTWLLRLTGLPIGPHHMLGLVNPKKVTRMVFDFRDGPVLRQRLLAWARERKLSLRNVEQIER